MAILRPSGEFDETYAHDMATIRRPWQWVLLAVVILALYLLPFYATKSTVAIVNRIAIITISVQGLNILTGYTGQISLGQGAFMMVGGYISALLVSLTPVPFLLALPIAGLGAGLAGLLFALPSLRVKGFYLVMATLAAQFILPWSTRHAFPDILNGAQGINVPVPVIFGVVFNGPERFIYLSLTALLISTIVAHNISRTRSGRAFVAIRDNDLAAELLGVNLFSYKLQAFFLASVFAGVAGALHVHNLRHVNSETLDLVDSIIYLGMLVIGGLGTNIGPFLGTTVVIVLAEFAAVAGQYVPGTVTASVRPLLFGLVLMLFLIFEPRGLAYRWQLIKAGWRLRPFSY